MSVFDIHHLQVVWEVLVRSFLTGLCYEVLVNWCCHLAVLSELATRDSV
jgi:hypothetical protein